MDAQAIVEKPDSKTAIIILFCLLYVAVGLGVMFPVLDNWFLGDDLAWLAQAKQSKSFIAMIRGSPWDGYFRPTFHALVWLEWTLFRTNPIWYHAVSLFLHLACGVLLALLVFLVSRHTWLSFLSGLIFLVLSPGSEAVYWISAQSALLAVVFVEASLCLLIVATHRGQVRLVLGSFVLYVGALGALSASISALLLLVWFALRGKWYGVASMLVAVTVGYVVAYTRLSPELSGRVLEVEQFSNLFSSFLRTIAEAYARTADPVGGSWAVGIGLAAATLVLGWRMRGIPSLHWIILIVLAPYALSLMRHQSQASSLPFDRYFYVARPGLSILMAVFLVQLDAAARCIHARVLAVVLLMVFLIFWAPSHISAGRKMELLYGEPSARLRNAIGEIQALDPGTPVRVVLNGFAVPECWLVPKVGTVFFESRLRCDRSDVEPAMQVVRKRDSSLRWYQSSVADNTDSLGVTAPYPKR